jgi:iron complex transport system substrate-binding protein
VPARPTRRSLLLGAPAALTALALASCGSDDTTTGGSAPSTTSAAGAFPVTVEHALGSATVESAPQRIVTVGWGSQDVLWALGLQPVAVPKVTYGGLPDGTYPWWAGHFDAATTTFLPSADAGEVPFEAIAEKAPDLILAVYSGITAEDYATLSKIAPTVAYPESPWKTSWQDQATLVGRAVGKEADAKALVERTQADLAARAAAAPVLGGKTFSYVYATEAGLSVYLPGDSRVDMLHDLGMVDSPGVTALAGTTEEFYTEVAQERTLDVAADVIVGYGGLTQAQLAADPVYATLPAVASGAVAWLADETLVAATSATVLNLPWQLDRLVPLLTAAAERSPA